MSLIVSSIVKVFNLEAVKRGDLIHFRRISDTTFRNGFVTKTDDKQIEIQFCNTQNNASSFISITAVDVAAGVWEIYWSSDLQTINYEYNGGVEIA